MVTKGGISEDKFSLTTVRVCCKEKVKIRQIKPVIVGSFSYMTWNCHCECHPGIENKGREIISTKVISRKLHSNAHKKRQVLVKQAWL